MLLLGEILYVERRLAGGVLQDLRHLCSDPGLAAVLDEHLAETRLHVERVETAFRRIDVAPTANLSHPFESAVDQHAELAQSIVTRALGDVFHAQAALHTEHWEIAAYLSAIELGSTLGYDDQFDELSDSLDEERRTGQTLAQAIERLSPVTRHG